MLFKDCGRTDDDDFADTDDGQWVITIPHLEPSAQGELKMCMFRITLLNLIFLVKPNNFFHVHKNQQITKTKQQEDHDGPISLTWPNRFAYLLLKFQPSSLL